MDARKSRPTNIAARRRRLSRSIHPSGCLLRAHPLRSGRDERERCARKRSEAERVGCGKCGHRMRIHRGSRFRRESDLVNSSQGSFLRNISAITLLRLPDADRRSKPLLDHRQASVRGSTGCTSVCNPTPTKRARTSRE
jgi:hypothetical protein